MTTKQLKSQSGKPHLQSSTNVDHLVIGALTVKQGVEYVKERLGINIPVGGKHGQMGTHNHLIRIGGQVFLEVIAIDPTSPAIPHPRWFGLDDPAVKARLALQPQLLTWVVNSNNLLQLQKQAKISLGQAKPILRGDLRWLFGVPSDGRLLASGLIPYVIEWQTKHHPCSQMQKSQCQLVKLNIFHPQPQWIVDILTSMGSVHHVSVKKVAPDSTPYLEAHIRTPNKVVILTSHLDRFE